ncbi:ABC transporter permease [Albimonas sp. CAU 1670]|uniref:ABC transporter permease n=1 Tax=Albimonas sp. CAU 1670 TaxID=3032599 RepID=UPI0023D9830C|nr:ABC transporter permease [Albimonas sp. CAU 1670]MDF2235114.1 ABC transporter permease [Albimonas sp. CAU 1670]
MSLLRLALLSLRNRRVTALLTLCAIALSTCLLLGVDTVRGGARQSFADTVSGTDLIVGARSGSVQLLLYSVFRIGNATNNVTWESYEDIAARPEVEWIVPISLGDSHRGFRVMGTTPEYFDRYRYRGGRPLEFAAGGRFDDLFDAVVGAEVAQTLGYRLGDEIVVAHGLASFTEHADKPFRIAGILARTGTPVDRTVHVGLEAIEAIHVDWKNGAQAPKGARIPAEAAREMDLSPKAITAALVGVKSRLQIFGLQRWINEYPEEPLLAVLPGVALQELWSIVGVAETALVGVSAMVVATALIGLAAMIFAGLDARRREMAILRAVGARPATILGLLVLEATLISAAGAALGLALLYALLALARPWVDQAFGLWLPLTPPGAREALLLGAVVAAGAAASLPPAIRAWRMSLADGMTIRT